MQNFIGTSNVTVPGNKSSFPLVFQSKTRLHYYSSLFNSVEINSSFYKIPLKSTFEKWAKDVPAHFKFSIKLFKEITHHKKLQPDFKLIEKVLNAADGLGNKKGCLLIQFPGKINIDYFSELELLLNELQQQNMFQWRLAVEFRNIDWYISETFELLKEYNTAIVLHDKSKGKLMQYPVATKFVYLRFHGPQGDYRESYTNEFLHQQAKRIMEWTKQGKEVYAYFNNTIGSAFENAQFLARLV